MADNHYNVAVLGAGPGGYVAAIRAAQLGARVAIIEKQYLGGTCLNVGCIPSKAMLHIAEMMHSLASLDELGIELPGKATFDMAKANAFKDKVVKRMTGGVGTLMKANNIDVYDGLGTVDASRTIAIAKNDDTQTTISADKIILATGSVPLMPPMPGIDGKNVINSDTCWNLPQRPENIICVGGGVIGMELACMFEAIGTKVTVMEMLPTVLAPLDEDVRRLLVLQPGDTQARTRTGASIVAVLPFTTKRTNRLNNEPPDRYV